VHPGYKATPKYVVPTTLTDDDLVDRGMSDVWWAFTAAAVTNL
jgi:hypothetical protein